MFALVLVFIGGALGTAAREGVRMAFLPVNDVPYATAAVNLAGAFGLGVLLETLMRRGSDVGRRQRVRLFAGTGFLGAFTTYSALAVVSADLIANGRLLIGVAYGLGTVVLGLVVTAAGIVAAGAVHRRFGAEP